MAKFEYEKDGKKEEIEFDDAILIDKIDTNDKSVWEKLFEKLGLKKAEKKDEEPLKPSTTDDYKERMSGKDEQAYNQLQEKIKELEEKLKNMNETSTASTLENLLAKALREGRIAKAEVDIFKTKFDTVYGKNIDILKDVLDQRKIDEKLVKDNNSYSEKGDDNGKDKREGGQPSFTRKQIADPEFFAKNKEAIKQAYKNDNIID